MTMRIVIMKKDSTHVMPNGKIMKGSKHMSNGGSVNMDSDLVPQRKRMAAGYKVNQGSNKTK